LINKEAMVGRALKQAFIATFLSLTVAACTTIAPRVEPAPVTKHRTTQVRVTTPKVVKQKKVTAKKLIKPVKNETTPVIAPLGGSGGGGGGGW
jgi:hypothetical protein